MPSGHASAFWHPFADMSAVAGHDLVIASGHGSYVTTEDGREFLDATAALWYANVGYGPDALTVHVAFMNSPAHKANILDRDYTEGR